MVEKARARSGKRSFKLFERDFAEEQRHAIWLNLANEANCFLRILGQITATEASACVNPQFPIIYLVFQPSTLISSPKPHQLLMLPLTSPPPPLPIPTATNKLGS